MTTQFLSRLVTHRVGSPLALWFNTALNHSFQDTVEVLEVADIPQSSIRVSIKLQRVGELPLRDAIEQFEKRGSDRPQDSINALNIILGKFNFSDADLLT